MAPPTLTPTETATAAPSPSPSLSPTDTEPSPEAAVFSDSFAENLFDWSTASQASSARVFRDGRFAIQVFDPVLFAWSIPQTAQLEDVHLKVNVSNVGGTEAAFGVLCSYRDAGQFYFVGFGDDATYSIARAAGDQFTLLTGEGQPWVSSPQIVPFQPAYTLEADCQSDGTLRLSVDGVTIAEAQDPEYYGAGGIGLFVQSFDNVPVDVEFDDLVVTQIE